MTLDETIEYLEEMVEIGETYDMGKVLEKDRQLLEWLKELKQLREQTKWIPVSKCLPEAGEYVGDVAKYYLVQNEYGDILVARYTHSEYWEQIYELRAVGDEIVAWMPLPEPYKVEREEA